jgi:hypothetical protein
MKPSSRREQLKSSNHASQVIQNCSRFEETRSIFNLFHLLLFTRKLPSLKNVA